MKKLLTGILVLGIAAMAAGHVTLQVYQADGQTLLDCNDSVAAGTKLTLVISSDSNDYWSGGLFIKDQDRDLATLVARDYDPNRLMYDPNQSLYEIPQFVRDWAGSHYESAGELARVTAWEDSSIQGFDLYTSDINDSNFVPGDWFVIDYYADGVGDCNVGFYDYSISWNDPNYCISFSHIPTRDLNSDKMVDFRDYAIFASRWNAADCNDPDCCDGADLDLDGDVDHGDLLFFTEYWL